MAAPGPLLPQFSRGDFTGAEIRARKNGPFPHFAMRWRDHLEIAIADIDRVSQNNRKHRDCCRLGSPAVECSLAGCFDVRMKDWR